MERSPPEGRPCSAREIGGRKEASRKLGFRDQLPIWPPLSFVITMHADRGRPPAGPSARS
jgi:hypothetical protein